MRPEESVPLIISDLYDGTMDTVTWDRAMLGIADLVRGVDTLVISCDPVTAGVLEAESRRYEPSALAEYCEEWAHKEVRYKPVFRAPILDPQFDTKISCWQQHLQSEIYNEFLRPLDIASFLFTFLDKSPMGVVALSIQGSVRRGPFEERDAQRIRPILPHARRALEIRTRLKSLRIRGDTLAASLDHAPFGVLILDQSGRLLEANAAAEILLCTEPVIRTNTDGTLCLPGRAGTDLHRWISGATSALRDDDGLLRIPRPTAPPLTAIAAPIPVETDGWTRRGARWVLLLFDPDRPQHLSAPVIAQDLGLTDREAEIAALIANGHDLKMVADKLCLSIHTIRSHLKSIFAKTGLSGQSELVRRIVSGPAGVNVAS